MCNPAVLCEGYGCLPLAFSVFSRLSAGSPFSVKVTGEGRIRESISRRQRAASVATVGSVCDLNLRIPGEETSPISTIYKIMMGLGNLNK